MFAKLYGEDDDQVLAVLDTDDHGDPAIRFSFKPKGLGICSVGVSFPDTDAGWDQAEAAFLQLDEDKVRNATRQAKAQCESLVA